MTADPAAQPPTPPVTRPLDATFVCIALMGALVWGAGALAGVSLLPSPPVPGASAPADANAAAVYGEMLAALSDLEAPDLGIAPIKAAAAATPAGDTAAAPATQTGAAPARLPATGPATETAGRTGRGSAVENLCADPNAAADACPQFALDAFFHALDDAAADGRRTVRVLHLGDSMIAADRITGSIRRRLQERAGNGGPGFLPAGRPWAWHYHEQARVDPDGRADLRSIVRGRARDRLYGVGGLAFDVTAGYALTIRPERTARDVSTRLEVHLPAGAAADGLTALVDGAIADRTVIRHGPDFVRVVFRAAAPVSRWTINFAAGGRVFGAVLEGERGGLVYDSAGVLGAGLHSLGAADPEHFARALAARAPDMIVLQYGANESSTETLTRTWYRNQILPVLRRVRAALPAASCLVVSPIDRGKFVDGRVESNPVIPIIAVAQREAAKAVGCAFFDVFHAMGGPGSARRLNAGRPQVLGPDLTHPTKRGADIIGTLIVDALEDARGRDRKPRPVAADQRDTPALVR